MKTLPGRGQWSAISGQQRRPSPGWPNSTAGQTRVGAYGIRPLPPQNLASGRWTILHHPPEDAFDPSQQSEFIARQLLRRYGVVFHKLLVREPGLPPWRDLLRAYRRLEARGEVHGGRFVDRFSGEQYALPEAVQQIRAIRRKKPDGALVTVNGADPLNLVGILTPGQKVPSLSTNRILYRDGVPVAVKIGGEVTYLAEKVDQWELPADMAAGR